MIPIRNATTFVVAMLIATHLTALSRADETSGNTVLVQFELEAADRDGAAPKDFFDRILPATVAYRGNLSAEYYVADGDPRKILLLEHWTDKAAFDAYLKWRIERGDFDTLKSLLVEEPMVSHFIPNPKKAR